METSIPRDVDLNDPAIRAQYGIDPNAEWIQPFVYDDVIYRTPGEAWDARMDDLPRKVRDDFIERQHRDLVERALSDDPTERFLLAELAWRLNQDGIRLADIDLSAISTDPKVKQNMNAAQLQADNSPHGILWPRRTATPEPVI